MSANSIGFQDVAELASQLSPEEQRQLILCIENNLSGNTDLSKTDDMKNNAHKAILEAIDKPPHLINEDVDELENVICASKMDIRCDGIFDKEVGG
jgi:hypothetical protein